MKHKILIALLALAGAAFSLTACSAGGSTHAPAGDVTACQHFKAQGQKLKSEATPSLADMAMTADWVQEDAQLAVTPSLKAAFTADSQVIQDLLGSFGDSQAQQDAIMKRGDDASARIKSACAADGVS
jgi:hypothetical protein